MTLVTLSTPPHSSVTGAMFIALAATQTALTSVTLNSAPLDMGLMEATRVNHVTRSALTAVPLKEPASVSRRATLDIRSSAQTNYVSNVETIAQLLADVLHRG